MFFGEVSSFMSFHFLGEERKDATVSIATPLYVAGVVGVEVLAYDFHIGGGGNSGVTVE